MLNDDIQYFLAIQPGVQNPNAPKSKVKDRGFKVAPDGRFIITEGNEKDDEVGVKKKKKKGLLLHSDSEDDYGKYNVIKRGKRYE